MPIFRYGENYEYVLRLVKEEIGKLCLTLIAYCLLPNHYHWLVRQDGEPAAGQLPQNVFNRYSKAFNNTYNHTGTLFEARFKAIPVTTDEYLRHLCRYIHGNPVVAGVAAAPELWPYSNYLEWIGKRKGTLVDRAFIETFFPAPGQYESFVYAYLHGQHDMPKGLKDYLDSL